jgi:hypothetical protein
LNAFVNLLRPLCAAAVALLAECPPVWATVVLSIPAQPITDPSALLPPVFPQNEIPAKEKPALARLCEDTLQHYRVRHRFSFGQSVFTRAPKWGDMVRIDYQDRMEGTRPHRINRVVCFRRPGALNFNIGYYENVPDDPRQRVWFSGVVLHLDE